MNLPPSRARLPSLPPAVHPIIRPCLQVNHRSCEIPHDSEESPLISKVECSTWLSRSDTQDKNISLHKIITSFLSMFAGADGSRRTDGTRMTSLLPVGAWACHSWCHFLGENRTGSQRESRQRALPSPPQGSLFPPRAKCVSACVPRSLLHSSRRGLVLVQNLCKPWLFSFPLSSVLSLLQQILWRACYFTRQR